MSDTPRKGRTLRRVGAVLAGFLVTVVLSVAVDQVLHASHVYPPMGQPMSDALFVLATAYRVLFSIAGCYVAARLAPDRPMSHAIALGLLGLVAATAGAVATWNAGPAFGPHWYPVGLIVTAIPCAWAGGRLHGMRVARPSNS